MNTHKYIKVCSSIMITMAFLGYGLCKRVARMAGQRFNPTSSLAFLQQ